MQNQIVTKPSKTNKVAFISAVVILSYGLFIFLVGVFIRLSGLLGCDRLLTFFGCPLPSLYGGVQEWGNYFVVVILTLILGLVIPILWILANGILVGIGREQQDGRKDLLLVNLGLNGLAFLVCLFAVVVMLSSTI